MDIFFLYYYVHMYILTIISTLSFSFLYCFLELNNFKKVSLGFFFIIQYKHWVMIKLKCVNIRVTVRSFVFWFWGVNAFIWYAFVLKLIVPHYQIYVVIVTMMKFFIFIMLKLRYERGCFDPLKGSLLAKHGLCEAFFQRSRGLYIVPQRPFSH